MSDHLSEHEIVRYRHKLCPPDELIRSDSHIARCVECRQLVLVSYDWRAALRGATSTVAADPVQPFAEHCTYEQLSAYVDGRLSHSEEELVRSHTHGCQVCANELADLETFKKELSVAHAVPGQRAGHQPTARLSSGRFTLARRLTSPRPVAVAAALALAIILAVGWLRESQDPPKAGSRTAEAGQPLERANLKPLAQSGLAEVIAALDPDQRRAVGEAIDRGQIALPSGLEELRSSRQRLMDLAHGDTPSAVLEPAGEVVMETTPLFRWRPVAAARSYSVAVFDTNLNPIQRSPELQATQWQPDRPLERGRIYIWQLTVTLRGGATVHFPKPPDPEAEIEVLQHAKAEELESLRRSHPDAHLVLGILYGRAGMLTPARSELQQVAPTDPHYDTAQRLLINMDSK